MMKRMLIGISHVLFALLVVVGLPCLQVQAQEPEHPEHPTATPTVEEVAMFLEGHLAETTKASDGLLTVHDAKAEIDRRLRLDKIHRERLAKTAEATYFVCADFKDTDGTVFDLDFWVEQGSNGLQVAETMIHKEEGEPRYTWHQEGDVWMRKPVE